MGMAMFSGAGLQRAWIFFMYSKVIATVYCDIGSRHMYLHHKTGTLPADLCANGYNSMLSDILISNNRLTGSLDVSTCYNLIFIDAGQNKFSGGVPDSSDWQMLHILHGQEAGFSGKLPLSLGLARLLTDVNLASNQLTGSLPASLARSWQYLSNLNLVNNSLSTSIPPEVFSYLGALTSIYLGSNLFTGTLPSTIGLAGALVIMDLHSNPLLHGSLPDTLVPLLGNPGRTLNVLKTGLSCCGEGFEPLGRTLGSYTYYNYSKQLLPRGLVFSSFMGAATTRFGNVTGLVCPQLLPEHMADVQENILDWVLDADYFLYQVRNSTALAHEKSTLRWSGVYVWHLWY